MYRHQFLSWIGPISSIRGYRPSRHGQYRRQGRQGTTVILAAARDAKPLRGGGLAKSRWWLSWCHTPNDIRRCHFPLEFLGSSISPIRDIVKTVMIIIACAGDRVLLLLTSDIRCRIGMLNPCVAEGWLNRWLSSRRHDDADIMA